ncbi:unnamed protein product [Sphagnum balticum]
MNKTEMIQELRALTQAGMSDCKAAIEHCQGDLQKAVDYLKIKGLNIADGRSGRAASEGLVLIAPVSSGVAMMEINCQTDFVANSPDFQGFARKTINVLCERFEQYLGFNVDLVEDARKVVVATTKENVVVRRWW